jgi:hypothetical protein
MVAGVALVGGLVAAAPLIPTGLWRRPFSTSVGC